MNPLGVSLISTIRIHELGHFFEMQWNLYACTCHWIRHECANARWIDVVKVQHQWQNQWQNHFHLDVFKAEYNSFCKHDCKPPMTKNQLPSLKWRFFDFAWNHVCISENGASKCAPGSVMLAWPGIVHPIFSMWGMLVSTFNHPGILKFKI